MPFYQRPWNKGPTAHPRPFVNLALDYYSIHGPTASTVDRPLINGPCINNVNKFVDKMISQGPFPRPTKGVKNIFPQFIQGPRFSGDVIN